MSAITAILIAAAAKVGAGVVKDILEKHVGGAAGEIGGTIIDAIAGKAGVEPSELPTLPGPTLEAAISQVEQDAPAIILAHVEQQREANRLMLAEMDKATPETWWMWGWRPAGMWLMLLCVAWYVMLRPIVNAVLWSFNSAIQIELGLDIGNFLGIFTIYTGLYMGGNTLLRSVKK
ncbi:3TM-type holin [Rhizobium sp. 18065]|uniref:3TM-type holin n=1 Tax=Rhizobium sp. 18065 TaxID=2681411 RepID=UPI0013583F8A|nr:3TM-type holin [Rhizobium sp. 18065]